MHLACWGRQARPAMQQPDAKRCTSHKCLRDLPREQCYTHATLKVQEDLRVETPERSMTNTRTGAVRPTTSAHDRQSVRMIARRRSLAADLAAALLQAVTRHEDCKCRPDTACPQRAICCLVCLQDGREGTTWQSRTDCLSLRSDGPALPCINAGGK